MVLDLLEDILRALRRPLFLGLLAVLSAMTAPPIKNFRRLAAMTPFTVPLERGSKIYLSSFVNFVFFCSNKNLA